MKSLKWKHLNHLFCRNVSFLTRHYCQFQDVGQGIKQSKLYLWYPLFQAQLNRCDQQNHQTKNYLVIGHHLYRGKSD
jgi:aspartyl/asparaginyl beta-hydroxylase (cupin superfamily)